MNGHAILLGLGPIEGTLPRVRMSQGAQGVRMRVDNRSAHELTVRAQLTRSGPIQRRVTIDMAGTIVRVHDEWRAVYSWAVELDRVDLHTTALVVGTIVLHPPFPDRFEWEAMQHVARRLLH